MSTAFKIHLARVRTGPFGGTLYTTLCGRASNQCEDGNNATSDRAAVTCKFCIARLPLLERNPKLAAECA